MRSKLLIALAVGFGSLILLIGILGFGVVQRVRQMSDQMEAAQRAYIQAEDLLGDISGDLQMVGILVRDYLLDPSSATAPEYRAQLIRQRNLIESRLQLLSTREFRAAEKLRKEVKAYLDSLDPLLAWTLQEKAAFGSAFMRHEVIPRRNAVVELSRQLNGLNLESLRTAEEKTRTSRAALMSFLKMTLAVALGLSLLIAAVTISRVFRLERRTEQERRRAEQAEGEQRRLARNIVHAQEQERKFLSLELHDAIGQTLTAVGLELGNLETLRGGPVERFRERLEEIKRLNAGAVRAVRDLAAGLRPATLDELGLGPALRAHAREFSRRAGVPVDVQIDGDLDILPEEHRTCIFRVVQEALNNCARHANAKGIRIVAYGREDWVHLTIQDDGAGFDIAAPRIGLGLVGIEERVRDLEGKSSVASQPSKGTTIDIELPVKARVDA